MLNIRSLSRQRPATKIKKTHTMKKELETIIENEFRRVTGQDMSNYEIMVCMDYVEFYYGLDWTTEDLRASINDFVADCYEQDLAANTYTIRDWWEFPMAHREILSDRVVITYRGGRATQYISQGVTK